MSRVANVKEERPELLEDQDFRELLEHADKIQDIKAVADMNGGKALINYLVKDVVNGVHYLTGHADSATHTELVAIIARMKANLATARFLSTAKGDVAHLDERIQEALRD